MTPEERREELRRKAGLESVQPAQSGNRRSQLRAKAGLGITPAAPEPQRTYDPNAIISEINDIQALDLQAQVASRGDNNLYVARDQSGAPRVSSLNEPSWSDYNPDAAALDYMPQGPGLQRQAVAMRGATLALGDEVAGAVFGDETRNALNMLTDKAYTERPGESLGIEILSGIPAAAVGANALGLRTGGAVVGGTHGAGQGNTTMQRTIGGLGGAAAGGILTSSGKGAIDVAEGAVNIGRRLRRAGSGQPSVSSNARDEFGVRLTQGQATNDIDQIAFEQAAARGGRSESAGHVLRPFMDNQRESVRSAGRGLAGNQFDTANDAGAVFSEGLKRRAGQERQGVQQAYETARGMDATLQSRGAQSMPDAVISGLDGDLVQQLEIDPDGFKTLYPNTAAALKTVASIGRSGVDQGLPFEQLENTRRILNRAIDASASNPADKRAAVQVKRSFDKFLDEAVDQKLFEGDEGFIEAYQKARGLRSEFARNFEANKVFDRLIKSDASPEQTLEFILGAAKIAPTERVRVVIPQLRQALGPDSPEWAALQEAAMKRVMAQTDRTYNPKVLKDNLQELLTGRNQTIAQELFSVDQYQRLRRFQGVVERLIPPEGAVNTSGTAYEIRRQLQSEGARIFNFPGGRTLSAAFQKYFPDRDMARARRAVRDDVVYRDTQPVPSAQLPSGPKNALDPRNRIGERGNIVIGGKPMRRKDVMRAASRAGDGQFPVAQSSVNPAHQNALAGRSGGVMDSPLPMLAATGGAGTLALSGMNYLNRPTATTEPAPAPPAPQSVGPSLKPNLDPVQNELAERANETARAQDQAQQQEYWAYLKSKGDGSSIEWNRISEERASELKVNPQDRARGVVRKRLPYAYDVPVSALRAAPIEELIDGEWRAVGVP